MTVNLFPIINLSLDSTVRAFSVNIYGGAALCTALCEHEHGIQRFVLSYPLGNGTEEVHRGVSAEQTAPSTKTADS